jgi:PAS domain S-box-containing protein
MNQIQVRIQDGQKGKWELPIIDYKGQELWVIAKTAPLFLNEEIVGEILLLEDVTERKVAERELKKAQQLMANIIDYLPDATEVIDMNRRTLFWNRAMVELTGVPASDIVGTTDYRGSLIFYGKYRPVLMDYIINSTTNRDEDYHFIQRDGEVLVAEAKTEHLKAGKPTYIWARAAPMYDLNGSLVGAIESVRDITDRKEAEKDLKHSNERLEAIFGGTVSALAGTTEKRDPYTAGHQQRVATLACAIATEMGMPNRVIDDIKIAATLHDIGKLYIPLDILNKSGPLSDIEQLFVKTHPLAGYDIVKTIPFEGPIAEIILQHHERLDGSGYPFGLVGEQILLEAKILSVADVLEAMSSHRPYRPALGMDKSLQYIQENAGKLFDEKVVNVCVNIASHGLAF